MYKNKKNLWFLLVHWVVKKNSKTYRKSKSSSAEVFCNKGVLKTIAKFASKDQRWSPSLTVTRLRCFHVDFAKCVRTPNL